ncbi:MAG TPA: replicative DNA helicase [Lacipirellulaceae bacterium]|nr:replicative DNA helicase [Lacipirellulaceae bacterium]
MAMGNGAKGNLVPSAASGLGGGDLFSKQIPQAVEAERAVLGSILLLPEVFDEVALVVRSTDFYDDANRTLFEHLLAMHDGGQRIDLMLLVDRLKKAGAYESIGGAAYLAEIGREVPTAAHAEFYARIVADKSVLRSLIHASVDIQQLAYDPACETREILGQAEERVFAILEDRGAGQVTPIAEVLQESLDRIDARMDHQHAFGGVPSGFDDFDHITGGLQKSELIILAARPSMGKTALAMNMAEHAAMQARVPTLFVSLEMSAIELGDRLLCSVAEVNGNRLRNGTITQDERRKLVHAAAEISQAPLFIDDSPSRTMTEIAANARRLKRRENLGLIVIDYLQLIDPDNPRDPRQEQVSKISRRLKGLARELQVPVLCLAQLNRQVESSHSNKPQLSHLRESGAIEQDADVVMFVHRDEYYQTNEEDRERVRGEADLLVRKQRNGPTGDVKLTWVHEFTRFRNFSHKPYAELESYGATEF